MCAIGSIVTIVVISLLLLSPLLLDFSSAFGSLLLLSLLDGTSPWLLESSLCQTWVVLCCCTNQHCWSHYCCMIRHGHKILLCRMIVHRHTVHSLCMILYNVLCHRMVIHCHTVVHCHMVHSCRYPLLFVPEEYEWANIFDLHIHSSRVMLEWQPSCVDHPCCVGKVG